VPKPDVVGDADKTMRQAVAWFVRRDAADPAPGEEDAFRAWLAADEAHGRAYADAVRVWRDAGELAGPAPVPLARHRRPRAGLAGRAAAMALAASLAVAAVFAADVPMRLAADARTGVGETRRIALPDGSVATLGTDAAIALAFTDETRTVRLLRGEAAFEVVTDAARPFDVEAAGGRARALGTRFLVRLLHGGAAITVLESRVAVSYPAGGDADAVAGPGQRIRYDAAGLAAAEAVDAEAEAAWLRGKLIVVDRPLGSVVAEIDRYLPGRIRIVDPAIGDRPVSGVFETADPLRALDAIERSLGLRSTRIPGLVVFLYR